MFDNFDLSCNSSEEAPRDETVSLASPEPSCFIRTRLQGEIES